MQYKLYKDKRTNEPCGVFAIDDNGKAISVPFAPGNMDYENYLKWLAGGNEPLPADE